MRFAIRQSALSASVTLESKLDEGISAKPNKDFKHWKN
jgi:hypothetical protein